MKHILILSVCLLLLWSCKKEIAPVTSDQYLTKVKAGLTDSLPSSTFQNLDFSQSVLNRVDSVDLYVLRVPFKSVAGNQDFIVVKTNREGEIQRGRIVHLELTVSDNAAGNIRKKNVNGSLVLRSLQGAEELRSPIENGYVKAFHKKEGQRTSLEMAPDILPEVIITYVRHLSGGISFSTWCMVQTFIMDYGGGGGGSWGGYYGSLDNLGGSSGGDGGGGSTGGGPTNGETILIDVETQDENPEIDLEKFINCFNAIPDAGSTCSIEIFSDIPVDNNPNAFYDLDAKSPGHTFINVSKSNGTQHVNQFIGFYPKSGYKAMTYAPVASKLVSNAGHEFNASLRMNLNPAQLATVLLRMQQLKNSNYDVDEYNCTDFALDVFNAVHTPLLAIPLYGVPGSPLTQATRTPGGLYNILQQMKNSNDPETGNITIGIVKGYAGSSSGPCN